MWKLSLLLCVFVLFSGCSSTAPLFHEHDLNDRWPHDRHNIDSLVSHMDQKINSNTVRIKRLEALLDFRCECDSECMELLDFRDESESCADL